MPSIIRLTGTVAKEAEAIEEIAKERKANISSFWSACFFTSLRLIASINLNYAIKLLNRNCAGLI